MATRATDARLDAWVVLRDQGFTVGEAAASLGISRAALEKTLSRARQADDLRGLVLPQVDHERVLEDWDIIWSHDTFEACARRLGISIHTLNEILVEARQAGDPRAVHPYVYARRRAA